MQSRRVLVTGGYGLLGHGLQAVAHEYPHLTFEFVRRGAFDLTDSAEVQYMLGLCRPDVVIHTAAVSGGGTFSASHPATVLHENVLMDLNLLQYVPPSCKLVLSLSIGMYPASSVPPYRETDLHAGPPTEAAYSYAYAKRLIDPAIRAYRHERGSHAIGLVPTGMLGEHANFTRAGATMVCALIRRCYEARRGTDPVVVWGDGTPCRVHTDSQDMARAYVWALEHYDDVDLLNVGTDETHSVRAIATWVAEALDIDPHRLVFDGTPSCGLPVQQADMSRFRARCAMTFRPFRETLLRTIQWFCAHYHEPGTVRL